MVEIEITNKHRDETNMLYGFDALNNSITRGKSNLYGAMGEILFKQYLEDNGYSFQHEGTYNFDFIADGKRWEVKTKRTTVEPRPNYLCSVADFNTEQECDYYVFARVLEGFEKGYLLGVMPRDEFYDKAIFKSKGDKDVNGFVFKADCLNMPIKMLYDMEEFLPSLVPPDLR